jgi:predicted transcriptional regulator
MTNNEPKTKAQLAEELNISLSTLQRWLKKLSINVPRGLISPIKQKELISLLGFEQKEVTQNDPK